MKPAMTTDERSFGEKFGHRHFRFFSEADGDRKRKNSETEIGNFGNLSKTVFFFSEQTIRVLNFRALNLSSLTI